jgi:MerR family copper efflux transcriptional regulator
VDCCTQLSLLRPAERAGGGLRLYDPTAADTIATIQQLEEHGLSLRTIAALNGAGGTDLAAKLDNLAAGSMRYKRKANTLRTPRHYSHRSAPAHMP